MNKKIISMLALGLLLGGGSIGAYQVMAQNNNATQTPATVQQQDVQDPSYHGSITVDETKYDGKSEQDESKDLVGLAKITADQAKQAAEAKVGGAASSVELGSENGSLVYEVKIGDQEVKVDADNGAILKIEQDDNEKDGIDYQFEGQEDHED
jgi:uncharacterized membrane protein YkoI